MNSVLISDKQALWLGRFQPPSIGHLIAVLAILTRWELLTIGVVYYSNQRTDINPKWKNYLNSTKDIIQSLGRNPFQSREIIGMWEAVLREQGISHRVRLVSMPQVAYQPTFNSIYPPQKYDFVDVLLTEHDPETDSTRQKAFKDFLDRPIEYIRTPWKIHISEIREQINKNANLWSKYIPQGGYRYFLDINGPARMSKS